MVICSTPNNNCTSLDSCVSINSCPLNFIIGSNRPGAILSDLFPRLPNIRELESTLGWTYLGNIDAPGSGGGYFEGIDVKMSICNNTFEPQYVDIVALGEVIQVVLLYLDSNFDRFPPTLAGSGSILGSILKGFGCCRI